MARMLQSNVQGAAPPLRKLTVLRKAYPTACYPLLSSVVAESRQNRLSLDETIALFEQRWKILGCENPKDALTSSVQVPTYVQGHTEDSAAPTSRRRWSSRKSASPGVAASPALLTTGVVPEQLRDGMAVFRGLLTPPLQQWLADMFFMVGSGNGSRAEFGCFWRHGRGGLRLNYGHRAQYVDELSEFPATMQELQAATQRVVEESGLCGDAPASVAIINFYGGRSNGMGWHVDADTDPPHVAPEHAFGSAVVSLSIGDSCEFCYREQGNRETFERIRLDSGDVLVFGGQSRGIEHCVNGIHSDTSPAWLNMRRGRINITFRYW
eukprot:TRINITY_DN24304_c0_g1_i1.p1 TRINITY_DN24304_c0_g1~~TRINITY_DN24304_c0_g1_i1.p1  ORF type:complete len:324 (-),score=41.23 TRINITY_DN24304_c0_g1_i1:41-1012(-)